MRLLDVQDPFFRPLWLRVLVTLVCFGWSAFEFVGGTPFWGVLFGALGVYCAWQFFVVFAPREPD